MRQIIIIVGLAISIFFSGITIMSVDEKITRRDELDRVVANATWNTVAISQPSGLKEFNSNEDMINEFINSLFLELNSDASIQIDFMGVDYKEGLLDVKVTERFETVNGRMHKIEVRKTAIYE